MTIVYRSAPTHGYGILTYAVISTWATAPPYHIGEALSLLRTHDAQPALFFITNVIYMHDESFVIVRVEFELSPANTPAYDWLNDLYETEAFKHTPDLKP